VVGVDSSEPPAIVPPWATGNPSLYQAPTYHCSPVHTPIPQPNVDKIGANALPLECGLAWRNNYGQPVKERVVATICATSSLVPKFHRNSAVRYNVPVTGSFAC